jgi:hypothetical protein
MLTSLLEIYSPADWKTYILSENDNAYEPAQHETKQDTIRSFQTDGGSQYCY